MGVGHAQATTAALRKDLKKDFGAVGDGRTNDQAAFEKAADFFNKRALTPAGTAPAVLAIPKGVYLVGRQDAAGNGADVLALTGCRNLRIEGQDSTRTFIRYADGLRYGAFDPATRQPYESPKAFFTDWAWGAKVGVCISLQKCENVEVSGLNLDGNSPHSVVGGHWGDTGIQLNYDGIFIGESRRITLRGLALHHFGRDGIQVLNHLAKELGDPLVETIRLENLTCTYNGRQGLSVTGVNGLRAVNCSFSHTGRVLIPALGKALFSNPGAGVDLEPEGGFVQNVRFDNCRMVDNAGQGLVADRPGNSHTTQNIVVNNSLIWGTTNWSAWVTQPGFLFQDCRIYGAFVHGCRADNAAEATRFVGCTFEDRPYRGQPAYGVFEMHSDSYARRMSFTNCRFIGTRSYLIHAIPQLKDTASSFHFRDCAFLLDYAQPPQGSYDKIMGSVFSGNSVFQNGPHRTSPHRTDFFLGDNDAQVSTVLRAPGSLRLLAPNSYYLLAGNFDIGRNPAHTRDSALVMLAADNALVLNAPTGKQAELYIGPTSRFIVKKGASLEVLRNTKVTIAGQLIVEDGAYFFRDPLAEVTTVGRGRLRLGAGVIKTKHPKLYSTY
ncbi:hypothetical protein A0257_10280 [Hymenobacter psoromatis]|nr:hypothetical protein A0257_10280 [Hymenobacter psoromatis]